MTYAERSTEAASFGGLVDAIGGIATIVLAIVALAGVHANILVPITVIVFGTALLIQGGAMLSEYARFMFPAVTTVSSAEPFAAGSVSSVFLIGAAGIVLGVLALLGIEAETLSAIAVIAFGSALVLSANSVRHLYLLRMSTRPGGARGGEVLAGEMASGSAGMQMLAGLVAAVLGILAIAGAKPAVLTLAALIVLGATVVLTGSALSGMALSFMRPEGSATS
jgi:hypothetical protein